MSATGGFNTKSPTIKRILKEAQELSTSPSPDYHAAPLETNLFEWHFTLRGPPSSAFASGLYHGRIVLPPSYPLRPPSFRFLTPSGRFEVNREICLSISGFHEESWQPAWGLRTALVALRSFMETEAKGQVGGVEASVGVRERLAKESKSWKCTGCGGKTNEEIIRDTEALVAEQGAVSRKEEVVPEELSLGYKDELEPKKDKGKERETTTGTATAPSGPNAEASQAPDPQTNAAPSYPTRTASTSAVQRGQPPPMIASTNTAIRTIPASTTSPSAWIDKAIVGLAIALAFMLLKKCLAT